MSARLPTRAGDGERSRVQWQCILPARLAALLPLATACLASNSPPLQSAPPSGDRASLLDAATSAARACDLERARESYARAKALCSACSPSEQVDLELVRVELALLAGMPREPTLHEGAQLAERLASADPLAAASLLARLGRWQAPNLLERAAGTLSRTEVSPRSNAHTALGIVLVDPDFVTRSELGRAWPIRYQLQSYHWQAPGSDYTRDDRYDAAPCPAASGRMGKIPGAEQQIFGQRVVYEKCEGQAQQYSLPGQPEEGVAVARVLVDPKGVVRRIDAHGAFLPAGLVQCLGDTLRSLDWGAAPQGGIQELSFRFLPRN